jgi:uncharacterized membrane protein
MNNVIIQDDELRSAQRMLHIIYALHALGIGIGAFGAASIIGSFLFGWPSVVAVVLSYLQRDNTRGTWLASHVEWAIRTFWIALGWTVLVWLVSLPLMLVVLGFGTLALGMFLLGVWAIYRIARGWLRLKDGQAMPAE